MSASSFCESCGMSIKTGKYCEFCAPNGTLLPLSELIEKMVKAITKKQGVEEEVALKRVISHLRKMPAWAKFIEEIEKEITSNNSK
ncbi:MAG: zinc ribbon domain-containing protein [Candidatus Nanoarchaeia archaeon]